MSEYPIIFNGESIRAILDWRKWQTRRVIPLADPDAWEFVELELDPEFCDPETGEPVQKRGWWATFEHSELGETFYNVRSRYGGPGDTLWVRETWALECPYEHTDGCGNPDHVIYRADYDGLVLDSIMAKWKSSRFMPRWASRIQRKITDLRVERVEDISEADCIAEGIMESQSMWHFGNGKYFSTPRLAFAALWDSINAKRGFGFDVNPWLLAISFEQREVEP